MIGGTPEPRLRVFSSEGLTKAQLAGRACVSCEKRWPRPVRLIGVLEDGSPLFACEDCQIVIEL